MAAQPMAAAQPMESAHRLSPMATQLMAAAQPMAVDDTDGTVYDVSVGLRDSMHRLRTVFFVSP